MDVKIGTCISLFVKNHEKLVHTSQNFKFEISKCKTLTGIMHETILKFWGHEGPFFAPFSVQENELYDLVF